MIDIPQKRMDPSAEPETSFSGLKKKEEVTFSKAQITNLKNRIKVTGPIINTKEEAMKALGIDKRLIGELDYGVTIKVCKVI